MLHGILRFDGHPSIMMGFHRNIEGIGPYMRFFLVGIFILSVYLDKHYVASPSLVQTSSEVGDRGTNLSDSKSELNLRTFSVMNETDGSGGVGESGWFSRLSLSSSLFPSVPSWGSLCCLGGL
ncbi:hypothetical protein Tco_0388758 [Tanacetum coccineum]